MSVIARDAVASDHLVYAWPFPIGPEEHEVVCADDEQVVMCPAWLVGSLLNTGRHRWRTPDPMRPVHAFFVLTAPVEVSFDMVTMFIVPATGEGIRLRAQGSLQVRCTDAALLIAQFVGLPFDIVNEGILRSVSRSIERMLARLLTRRVVMAGTAAAVTDPQMQSHILEELVAYNPAAGAVFGVELVRMGHLAVLADDGSRPLEELVPSLEWSGHHRIDTPTERRPVEPVAVVAPIVPSRERATPALPSPVVAPPPMPPPLPPVDDEAGYASRGSAAGGQRGVIDEAGYASRGSAAGGQRGVIDEPVKPVVVKPRASSQPPQAASGEIVVRTRPSSSPPPTPTPPSASPSVPSVKDLAEGTPVPPTRQSKMTKADGLAAIKLPEGNPTPRLMPSVPPPVRKAAPIEVPKSTDEITQPGVPTPVPGSMRIGAAMGVATPAAGAPAAAAPPAPAPAPVDKSAPRGAIMGIGTSSIGSSAAGEIPQKVSPGTRVLVPGPNGLMQSATVRQLLQGYYELEVGASGETIWVPINGVVPHD